MRQTANAKRKTANSSFFDSLLSVFAPGPATRSGTQGATAADDKKPWYRNTFFKRIVYAVLSLLLAMLLWGYVLMTQNPDREKSISGIAPVFESGAESDLIARKLMIYGDITEVLDQVTVTVSAPLTEISKVSKNNITATVSLSEVHSAGSYELEVKATSTIGSVVSIEPSTISVTVDDLISRSVAITYDFVGELPEAYWHDVPTLYTTSTTLEGARTDLEKVDSAVCYIDLTGVSSTFSRSLQLSILDKDKNVMDNSTFKNVIPSVNVTLRVLPHKHVNIVYELIDKDQIPEIYEIQSETLSVDSIDIAADAETLAQIETISSLPVSVIAVDDIGDYSYPIKLTGIPAGSVIIDGTDINDIHLTVSVGDKIVRRTFSDIPIRFMGEREGLSYEYDHSTAQVVLEGAAKLIDSFVTSDIVLSINVTDRGVGQYDLGLEYKFNDVDTFGELGVILIPQRVHVSITEAQPGGLPPVQE